MDLDGHIRLTDFGLSKVGMEPYQMTDSFCGSPEYMAPEVVLGNGYNYAVDFYTLGALLHEFMIGYPPYYDENPEIILKNIKTKELKISLKLSKLMRIFLYSLLNKQPKQRTQKFEEIKTFKLFENYDWETIELKKSHGPIHISLYSSNINDEFLNLTYRDNETKKFRRKFDSFNYICPGSHAELVQFRSKEFSQEEHSINTILPKGLAITQSHDNLSSAKKIFQSMEILNSLKRATNRSIERKVPPQIVENRNLDSGFFAELKKRLETSTSSISENYSENKSLIKSFTKTEHQESNTRKLFMSLLEQASPINNIQPKIIEEDELFEQEFQDSKVMKKPSKLSSPCRKLGPNPSEGNFPKGNITESEFSYFMSKLKVEKPNFQKLIGNFQGNIQKLQTLKEKLNSRGTEKKEKSNHKATNNSDHFNSTVRNLTESSVYEKSEFNPKEKPLKTAKIQTIRSTFTNQNNFSGVKVKSETREPIINALKNSKSSGNILKGSTLSSSEIRKSLEFIARRKSPVSHPAKTDSGIKSFFESFSNAKRGSLDRQATYSKPKSLKSNSSENTLKPKTFHDVLRNSQSIATKLKSKAFY